MVLLSALHNCDDRTTSARATQCLAIWRGPAPSQHIAGIATSTMVLLRALHNCDERAFNARATSCLAVWQGPAPSQRINCLQGHVIHHVVHPVFEDSFSS